MKQFSTDAQLAKKLTNYNINFTKSEFDELIKHGFYHVFNSFVPKSDRQNGSTKELSDYLSLYKIDKKLRAILFSAIIEIEGIFKQNCLKIIAVELGKNSNISADQNDVIKFCVEGDRILKTRRIFADAIKHECEIVKHYFGNHMDIPIWAYLELMTMGSFINFVNNTKTDFRKAYNIECNFYNFQNRKHFSYDNDHNIVTDALRPLKDLRNNIAHNQQIIDCRFKQNYKANLDALIKDIARNLNNSITINQQLKFDFLSITDFVILTYVIYILTKGKDEISDSIMQFMENNVLNNSYNISSKILSRTFGHNCNAKINFLKSL